MHKVQKTYTAELKREAVRLAQTSGDAIFSTTIAQRLIDFFASPRPAPAALPFPDLTDRAREAGLG